MKVVWSDSAEADLLAIWIEIASARPRSADRMIDELDRACGRLARAPGSGRSRDELSPGLRSLPVRRYVIFYRASAGRLEVARVLHGARDLDALF